MSLNLGKPKGGSIDHVAFKLWIALQGKYMVPPVSLQPPNCLVRHYKTTLQLI